MSAPPSPYNMPVAHPVPTQPVPTVGGFTQPWENSNGEPQVIPMSGPIKASAYAGGAYLKGTDVPDGQNVVSYRLLQFVRDPQGRSKLVAQISETYGKKLFGFNTTNIRALASLGFDDLQGVVGRTVHCMIGMQPNPQRGGAPTKALFVQRVE